MKYKLTPILRRMGACEGSLQWLARANRATFADAWNACERHDWMCWLIGRTMPHREIVALACDLAEAALAHATDPRPRACIDTVRAWLRGEATIEEVRGAQSAYAAAAAPARAHVLW